MEHLIKLQSTVNRSIYQPLSVLWAFYKALPDDYLSLSTNFTKQTQETWVGYIDLALNAAIELINRLLAIRADMAQVESSHRLAVKEGQISLDFESDRVELSDEVLAFIQQERIDIRNQLER